jgi:hypothetical protein
MLAFTMQFSRYGRNHASGTSIRRSLLAGRLSRPALESGCFLRTQQRAHPAAAVNTLILTTCQELVLTVTPKLEHSSVRSFRRLTEVSSVLAALSRRGGVNSQCSTRKHGRSRSRSLRKSAGAP